MLDIHVIAAIKADETYDNLKTGFGDVINSINSSTSINSWWRVEFFFVSDYKVSFAYCITQ